MNEFDQRLIDVSQAHVDLSELAQCLGSQVLIEHFGYTLQLGSDTDPLLNGVTQSGSIALQSDAWFVLQYISTCVLRPDVPFWFQDAGTIKLRVTGAGGGDVFYSTPQSAGVLTATLDRAQTGIPFLLPIPRIIPPNTNLQIDATQVGVNVTDNEEPIGFWITFGGSRIAMV